MSAVQAQQQQQQQTQNVQQQQQQIPEQNPQYQSQNHNNSHQQQQQQQHQRAPRTPESYFNVPESIALLNIVKSDRIQSAFQSNRKNHASVWEMVAEILSRYNNRKRSAKQCCNRYENLKKIYTQLKRNPEKHVRRNWPYMYLFRQIEEQRGESWGSSAAKRRNEMSYYHRRRAFMLINNNSKDPTQAAAAATAAALLKLEATNLNLNNNNNISNKDQALFIPNQFLQTEIRDCDLLNRTTSNEIDEQNVNGIVGNGSCIGGGGGGGGKGGGGGGSGGARTGRGGGNDDDDFGIDIGSEIRSAIRSSTSSQLNLDTFDFGGLIHVKEEPQETDYDEHDREISYGRINNNYNGQTELYMNGHHNNNINGGGGGGDDGTGSNCDLENDNETNILHPDVIVDTDHVTDSSVSNQSIINLGTKRKNSTSSDDESTNYELIEYLKRREKRDVEMLKRMENREERLINLLERTVVAIERIASHNCNNNTNQNLNNNNNCNNTNNSNSSSNSQNNNLPNHK